MRVCGSDSTREAGVTYSRNFQILLFANPRLPRVPAREWAGHLKKMLKPECGMGANFPAPPQRGAVVLFQKSQGAGAVSPRMQAFRLKHFDASASRKNPNWFVESLSKIANFCSETKV